MGFSNGESRVIPWEGEAIGVGCVCGTECPGISRWGAGMKACEWGAWLRGQATPTPVALVS